jgi:hypothetical protein
VVEPLCQVIVPLAWLMRLMPEMCLLVARIVNNIVILPRQANVWQLLARQMTCMLQREQVLSKA